MRRTALIAAALVATLSCKTSQLPDLQPGEAPELASDEAGFWMAMDRVEQSLRTSGRVVRDPLVNEYVGGLVCRLAGSYCEGIRVYVVQTPHFNASMRPNGTMEVWTGLMLRATSEAQLAFVLAHEIGHYRRRHTLSSWRRLKTTTDALAVFSVVAAGAGAGYAGDLASLAAAATLLAFDRDQEREADRIGFETLVREGYDPREAAAVWAGMLAEQEAEGEDEPLIFFSTHPPTAERVATLEAMAKQAQGAGAAVERERYLEVVSRVRAETLREEIALRQPKRSEAMLARLAETGAAPAGEVAFYRGELYRTRGERGDVERALTAYRAAVATPDAPPEAHRSLGLVLQKQGERDAAHEEFRRYLAAKPDASDRLMIESWLVEAAPR